MKKISTLSVNKESIWEAIRLEVFEIIKAEPELESFMYKNILNHGDFKSTLVNMLSSALCNESFSAEALSLTFTKILDEDSSIMDAALKDIIAFVDRDPSINTYSSVPLFCKGYKAMQAYRLYHHLWRHKKYFFASFLQSRCAELYAVDIHPAAKIGNGIFIDHATGIVIGETAVVGNDVSLLHEVTLGGTGKIAGDRHPKVESNVLIGAGAKVLGNVSIGKGAKIGAGSVVLKDVESYTTVAGVPAVKVKEYVAVNLNTAFDMG